MPKKTPERAPMDTMDQTSSKETPMGISNWLRHGKKYGYLDYFMQQEREKFKECSDDMEDIKKRFWAKVKKPDGCWLWTGSNNGLGYGEIRIKNRKIYAHRWSYENIKGVIAAGLDIDHLCRNPTCVNPDHLEAVTHKENIIRGTKINVAKLKASDIPLIRELLVNSQMTLKRIGEIFGVTPYTIWHIKQGKTWTHI